MLRAVVYMRKSSDIDREDKQKYSKERQEIDIQDFLDLHNESCNPEDKLIFINGKEDYFFDDISGRNTNRTDFNKMIRRIKDKRYDALICTDISRLARNPIDAGILTYTLDERNLRYVYTADGKKFDANINTDRFTLSMFLSIAKYENDNRGTSTKSGMNRKKIQGGTTNIAPFGYLNDKNEKTVVPDDRNDLFRKLQGYWDLFATGGYTLQQIADLGKEENLRRYNDDVPNDNIYGSMFRSRYYTGKVRVGMDENGEEIWIKGSHESMVDEELFEKVQQILAKTGYRHKKPLISPTYENLLRDLLICGKSKEKMFLDVKVRYTCERCKTRSSAATCPNCGEIRTDAEKKKAEIRRYYVAPKGFAHVYGKNETPTRSIKAEYIEGLIDAELSKITISDGLFDVLRKRMYTLWLEENTNMEKEQKVLRRKIQSAEEDKKTIRKNMLLNKSHSFIGDEGTMDAAEQEIADRDEKIIGYQKRLHEIEAEVNDKFERAWELLNVMFEMKKVFGANKDVSFEPKRNLLISVCSNQIFTDGKIEIIWKKPFGSLISKNLTKKKSQTKSEISDFDSEWLPE